MLLLMEEILQPVDMVNISSFAGFHIHVRWCRTFSIRINSIIQPFSNYFWQQQKTPSPQKNCGCYPRHQEASTGFTRAICGSALSDVTTGVLEITGETFRSLRRFFRTRDPWKVVLRCFIRWWFQPNPFEQYNFKSNWIISPSRGENTKYLKLPINYCKWPFQEVKSWWSWSSIFWVSSLLSVTRG